MTVGEKIRELRKEQKMSQELLAKKLGIPYQSISQYERGKRNPKLATLSKIADALGVPVSQFLNLDGLNIKECSCRTFGKKLKGAREKAHMTQEDLAKALGISLNSLGRYERDEREPGFCLRV